MSEAREQVAGRAPRRVVVQAGRSAAQLPLRPVPKVVADVGVRLRAALPDVHVGALVAERAVGARGRREHARVQEEDLLVAELAAPPPRRQQREEVERVPPDRHQRVRPIRPRQVAPALGGELPVRVARLRPVRDRVRQQQVDRRAVEAREQVAPRAAVQHVGLDAPHVLQPRVVVAERAVEEDERRVEVPVAPVVRVRRALELVVARSPLGALRQVLRAVRGEPGVRAHPRAERRQLAPNRAEAPVVHAALDRRRRLQVHRRGVGRAQHVEAQHPQLPRSRRRCRALWRKYRKSSANLDSSGARQPVLGACVAKRSSWVTCGAPRSSTGGSGSGSIVAGARDRGVPL